MRLYFLYFLSAFFTCSISHSQNTLHVRKEKQQEPASIVDLQPEVFTLTEKSAEYPGGLISLYKFITSNLKPSTCSDSVFIGCTVYLKFVVDENGNATNGQILKGCRDCPNFEDEALKIVPKMAKWTPAMISNKPVKSYYQIPIKIHYR